MPYLHIQLAMGMNLSALQYLRRPLGCYEFSRQVTCLEALKYLIEQGTAPL